MNSDRPESIRGQDTQHGWVEVVCGPMFSGKSEELIRRLKRAQIARQPLQAFKPDIDNRYHDTKVMSHTSISFEAEAVKNTGDLLSRVRSSSRVIGIDEVQFFDESIIDVVERLADSGVRVIVAGLDQDYKGNPFGPMPALLCKAEYVTKTLAICIRCGREAGRSQRLFKSSDRVFVGSTHLYEARCRRCHSKEDEFLNRDLFDTNPGIQLPKESC